MCIEDYTQTPRLIVYCRGVQLNEIPSFAPSTNFVSKLIFSFNSIKSIPANAFRNVETATTLDLTNNQISRIDERAFDNLTQLFELSISIYSYIPVPQWSWTPLASILGNLRTLLIGHYLVQLDNSTFVQATNLEKISLLDCGIQSIPDELFMHTGKRIIYLDFDKNKLSSFPSKALSFTFNLNVLNISNNPLGSLPANAVPNSLRNLAIIEFDNCSLTSISPYAFASNLAYTMSFIDLTKNLLNQEVFESFGTLRSLSILSLPGNKISNIDKAFQSCCEHIQTLDLSDNLIGRLSAALFSPLVALRTLKLDRNNISVIDVRAFEGLSSLSTLTLTGNVLLGKAINAIPAISQIFSPIGQSLTVLDFSNIGFREEHHALFKPLKRLERLILALNPIRSVPQFLFQSLASLQILNLQRTQLSDFNARSLVGPQQLTTLDLSYNNISTLDVCLRWQIQNASALVFTNNPLLCDCNLRWLREWRNVSSPELDPLAPICIAPLSLAGQKFHAVSASSFVCPAGQAARNMSSCEDLDLLMLQNISSPLDWTPKCVFVSANLVYISYKIRWSDLLLAYSPAHVFSIEFIDKETPRPAILTSPINATGNITDVPEIREAVPDSPYPTHLRLCIMFVTDRRNTWLNPINCRTEAIPAQSFNAFIPLFIAVPLLLVACAAGILVLIVVCCVRASRSKKGITGRDISAPITQQTLTSLVHTMNRYEKTTGIKSAGSQQDLVSPSALKAEVPAGVRTSRWGSSPNLAEASAQPPAESTSNEYDTAPLPKRPMREKSLKRMRDREAARKRGERVLSTRSQIETIYETMPGEDPDGTPAPLPDEARESRLSPLLETSESSPGESSSGIGSTGQSPARRTPGDELVSSSAPRTSGRPAPNVDPRSSQPDPSHSSGSPTAAGTEFMALPLGPPPPPNESDVYANPPFGRSSAARPPSLADYNVPRARPPIKADPNKPLPKLYAAAEGAPLDEYQVPPSQRDSSQAATPDEYLVPPLKKSPERSDAVPLSEYLSPPLRSSAGGAAASSSPPSSNYRASIDEYANLRASNFKEQTALLDFVDDSLQ